MVAGFGGIGGAVGHQKLTESQIVVVVAGHSMSGLPDDAHYIFNFLTS